MGGWQWGQMVGISGVKQGLWVGPEGEPEKGKAKAGNLGLSSRPSAYRLSKWLKSKRLNSRLSSAW